MLNQPRSQATARKDDGASESQFLNRKSYEQIPHFVGGMPLSIPIAEPPANGSTSALPS